MRTFDLALVQHRLADERLLRRLRPWAVVAGVLAVALALPQVVNADKLMLATLGLTERGDYHHLNALKNMLSIVIAAVAIVVFVSGGVVAWYEAVVMIPGVAAGGYAGVWAAKRVPQNAVRGFVIAVGLFLAAYYFMTG